MFPICLLTLFYGIVTGVYAPRFFVSSQQKLGVTVYFSCRNFFKCLYSQIYESFKNDILDICPR